MAFSIRTRAVASTTSEGTRKPTWPAGEPLSSPSCRTTPCHRCARREGVIPDDALAVAVLTANGRGWSEHEPGLFDVAFADDVASLLRAIST